MPVGSGSLPFTTGQVQPAMTALTSYSDTVRIELTNFAFQMFVQLEPTDIFCSGDSGNAMSFPEWLTTGVNFASWGFALVGVFLVLVVSFLGYGSDKLSRRSSGEGGGKNAALLGVVFLAAAALTTQIPSISGDAYDGMEACFALIEPVTLALI